MHSATHHFESLATRHLRVLPVRLSPGSQPRDGAPCFDCRLRTLCLPRGLSDDCLHRLDGLIQPRRLRASQPLYREGDRLQSLFAVRSGSLKCSLALRDGREQVSSLRLPGDLLGLDGVAEGCHASTATALEDAELCAIPYAGLLARAREDAALLEALTRALGVEIAEQHAHAQLLGGAATDERLARFLLDISERLAARGYSPDEFHLRLSRAEIGSYLGMTLETVSRTLSAFQQRGWLTVDKRHLRIVARAQLLRIRDEGGAGRRQALA